MIGSAPKKTTGDTAFLYGQLRLIRRTEERIAEVYSTDAIKSPVHLAIGQEAISVGVCANLTKEDIVGCTYRSHAAYLAKGAPLNEMMAEMYGKSAGCAAGKGGSMHLISKEFNVLGSSAVVGTGVPIATGYALALKQKNSKNVVVCFLGDGATEEGVFSESLNFAALHHLPVLYVVENNGYAIHEPLEKRQSRPDAICERVATYGINTVRIEDQDIFRICDESSAMINRMREGGGPAFLECLTYRWREHVGPSEDYDAGYRSDNEVADWKQNDQLDRLAAMLPNDEFVAINSRVEVVIDQAFAFAEDASAPAREELFAHVFAE
ncbi:thiamine pyrophosphate-dependent dehydrogenase E1 component subunit alpha [Alphaproteobacteria bacterium]|jgi:pyruvate dehydrogenase E1 component alpha subunit|nr:thiamine pyrophosphate-dependent dehydrogenase E1 component subunit alpha [Alphaproteobacteria bacterium]